MSVCDVIGLFTKCGGMKQSKDLGLDVRRELKEANEDLLKDVKVYSSSEGRVISTASTFSCVFLETTEPPEIAISKEMLDDSNSAKVYLTI
jgi:inositol hexakisphosphate/diphosphoinositol-pentakisphosphate kinase